MKDITKRIIKQYGEKPPQVFVLAKHRNRQTGEVKIEVGFKTTTGAFSAIYIAGGEATDARGVHRRLLDHDAALSAEFAECSSIIKAALNASPPEIFEYLEVVGWVNGHDCFTTHTKVFGAPDGHKWEPPMAMAGRRHVPKVVGSLAEWQKAAEIAAKSSRLTMALTVSFAAPLLRLSGLGPFGVMVYGPSKCGKSTAALLAASVIGFGREFELPNWDVTDAGFQEIARGFNDHSLTMNELAVVRAKGKGGVYDVMQRHIYSFAEGAEATRHSASAFATRPTASTWSGILLATSERSVTQHAAQAGAVRDGGEFARFIEVPALRTGGSTVMTKFPEEVKRKRDWAHQQLRRVREIVAEHHGAAFKQYVEWLVRHKRGALSARVNALADKFVAELELQVDSAVVNHAARNFGILYAGGRFAIEAKVLPLTDAWLLAALKSCFNDAIDNMPLPELMDRKVEKALKIGFKRTTWRPLPTTGVGALPGPGRGYTKKWHSRTLYCVAPDEFDCWFGDDRVLRQSAIKYLVARKLIRLIEGRDPERQGFTHESYAAYEKLGIVGRNWRCVRLFRSKDRAAQPVCQIV